MSADEEFFGFKNKKKKAAEVQLVDKLYEKPKKDKGVNMPRFQEVGPNVTQQADLLFMPTDNGYKYILVVADVGTRKSDAVPLKSKTADEVLQGFKTIYKRGTLKIPMRMETDPGGEFKGVVKDFFKEKKVYLRYGKPGRHRMQAIVERENQTIAKALFRRMSEQELLTEQTSTEWVEDLPKLIKVLNKRAEKRKKPKLAGKPLCSGDSCNLLRTGTKVRAILEEPKDYVSGKRLTGKFRSTDLRWDPRERVIREVLLKPNSPPLYLLDGNIGDDHHEPVAYTKNQLQVIGKEALPKPSVIRGKPEMYVVERITGMRKIKGKIYYRVKWRGYPDEESTEEPRTQLLKDVPDIVKAYEAKKK